MTITQSPDTVSPPILPQEFFDQVRDYVPYNRIVKKDLKPSLYWENNRANEYTFSTEDELRAIAPLAHLAIGEFVDRYGHKPAHGLLIIRRGSFQNRLRRAPIINRIKRRQAYWHTDLYERKPDEPALAAAVGDIVSTEVVGPLDVGEQFKGHNYKRYSRKVNRIIRRNKIKPTQAPPGTVNFFDRNMVHRIPRMNKDRVFVGLELWGEHVHVPTYDEVHGMMKQQVAGIQEDFS